MAGWVAVLAVAVAIGIVIVVLRERRRQERAASTTARPGRPDPLGRDPLAVDVRQVGVGAVVNYGGRDFVVRGTLELDTEGFRWQEHLLDDAEVRRWLSVEEDEELEVVLWEARPSRDVVPGAPSVEFDGVVYELDEHGRASFRAEGTTGTTPSGRVEYWDYVGTGAGGREQRLSFERFGSESWELGVGRRIPEASLDIYPAVGER